jgi:DNA-binding CsgD family transcriptional regulator
MSRIAPRNHRTAPGSMSGAGARQALRHAVLALVHAPGRKRFDDPKRVPVTMQALLEARWSIVDHFKTDGTYYLVALASDLNATAMGLLTERERQVAALVAAGFSNKAIACELGIATSTVGVLLGRAMHRTGARSRRELVRIHPSQTLRRER